MLTQMSVLTTQRLVQEKKLEIESKYSAPYIGKIRDFYDHLLGMEFHVNNSFKLGATTLLLNQAEVETLTAKM